MPKYSAPSPYYYRLHHVRPRFKNDVENVLGFVSFGIASIEKCKSKAFNNALDEYIRSYGTNACSTQKTIQNWRTEIAALFGMYIEDGEYSYPSSVSIELANNSNLNRFFQGFIYSFQYPGGHLKSNYILDLVQRGIRFHPGQWLANYLLMSNDCFITKAEFCHCVMNDMRVTRDHEKIQVTANRIKENRKLNVEYDNRGDVVRYAGDILDYLVLADLAKKDTEGRYYRKDNTTSILKLISSFPVFFEEYSKSDDLKSIHAKEVCWFKYVEACYKKLSTLIETLGSSASEVTPIKLPSVPKRTGDTAGTKETGDQGENLALAHEKLRLTAAERKDLIHLIKRMPTHLAVGYDIKSIEADTEIDRMIEVKTSISKAPLSFNRIHLTTNEWRVAEACGDRYYIYRLQISDDGYKLFLVQNPVQKYKNDQIRMVPRDGADLILNDDAGEFVELLCVR